MFTQSFTQELVAVVLANNVTLSCRTDMFLSKVLFLKAVLISLGWYVMLKLQ